MLLAKAIADGAGLLGATAAGTSSALANLADRAVSDFRCKRAGCRWASLSTLSGPAVAENKCGSWKKSLWPPALASALAEWDCRQADSFFQKSCRLSSDIKLAKPAPFFCERTVITYRPFASPLTAMFTTNFSITNNLDTTGNKFASGNSIGAQRLKVYHSNRQLFYKFMDTIKIQIISVLIEAAFRSTFRKILFSKEPSLKRERIDEN